MPRNQVFCYYCKIILVLVIPVITGRSAVDNLALGLGLSRSLDLDLLIQKVLKVERLFLSFLYIPPTSLARSSPSTISVAITFPGTITSSSWRRVK
ncbi:hypothetical protein V1477_003343 [Vespula maculifrons]|uniref:Secreted protein n=1 Tax=Vespula maculifrons TaxID=7453 RepID=A0ABD2CUD1_VESMC